MVASTNARSTTCKPQWQRDGLFRTTRCVVGNLPEPALRPFRKRKRVMRSARGAPCTAPCIHRACIAQHFADSLHRYGWLEQSLEQLHSQRKSRWQLHSIQCTGLCQQGRTLLSQTYWERAGQIQLRVAALRKCCYIATRHSLQIHFVLFLSGRSSGIAHARWCPANCATAAPPSVPAVALLLEVGRADSWCAGARAV